MEVVSGTPELIAVRACSRADEAGACLRRKPARLAHAVKALWSAV